MDEILTRAGELKSHAVDFLLLHWLGPVLG
jgi:hypothetical protein